MEKSTYGNTQMKALVQHASFGDSNRLGYFQNGTLTSTCMICPDIDNRREEAVVFGKNLDFEYLLNCMDSQWIRETVTYKCASLQTMKRAVPHKKPYIYSMCILPEI